MSNSSVTLLIRKLDIDLSAGFARHWQGGDAFRSMYFNALSMSFPVGEQFFIDAVRAGLERLPDTPAHAAMRETARQFIGQEASHRHLHHLYNQQLQQQGLRNRWEHWAGRRIRLAYKIGFHPLNLLALTAAYEHVTAVFADNTLRRDDWLQGAAPMMQTLWRWHAAEETEHKAVAFDLYQALGGGYGRRIWWFCHVQLLFWCESSAQTLLNLWHDDTLFNAATWRGGLRFLFGRNGLWRASAGPLLRYLRPRFHPDQHDNRQLAQQWLQDHAAQWRRAGR